MTTEKLTAWHGRRGRPRGHSLNGLAFRHLREAQCLTREALAEKAGVNARTIARAEHGHRISSDSMERLIRALSVDENQVLLSPAGEITLRLRERGLATQRPPTAWVSRPAEVELVRTLLTAETPRICCIAGPSGIGKTALARFIAQSLETVFPDGVVWVDASQESRPVALLEVQLRIADALEFRARLPPPEQVSPANFAAAFATEFWSQKRMLILDDVLSIDTVNHFVPLDPSVPLLATTHLLHVAGYFGDDVVPLGPISVEDTRHIIIHRLGAERARGEDGIGELHATLSGIPRSIQIAATILARERLVTLHDYAARIRRNPEAGELPEALRSPSTSLQLSFAQIQPHVSAPAWSLLGALSLFDNVPFSLDWAAAIKGEDHDPGNDVPRLISELIDIYLVIQDAASTHADMRDQTSRVATFRLESHVPLFARTIPGPGRNAVLERLVRHALHKARVASEHNDWREIRAEEPLWTHVRDILFRITFSDPDLLQAWDSLVALAAGIQDEARATDLLALTLHLVTYLENDPLPAAGQWLCGALACARAAADHASAGRLLLALGRHWLRAHVDLDRAVQWFDAATDEFVHAGAPSLASAAASEAGRALFGCERPLEGVQRFTCALDQVRMAGDRGTELACRLNSVGVSFTRCPEGPQALASWQHAAVLLREAVHACVHDDFDSRFFRIVCTCNLAAVCLVLARHGTASPLDFVQAHRALDEATASWHGLGLDAPIFEARLVSLKTMLAEAADDEAPLRILELWHSSLREDRRSPQDLLWQIGEAAYYLRLQFQALAAPDQAVSPVIAQGLAISDVSREIAVHNNHLVPIGLLFPIRPLAAVFTSTFISEAAELSIAIYGERNRVLNELRLVAASSARVT